MRNRRILAVPVLAFLLLGAACEGQVRASFNLQPYKAVKSAFGTAVVTYSVTICNGSLAPIDSDFGRVRQAAAERITTTAAVLVGPTLTTARNKNNWVKAARLIGLGLGIVAPLAAGEVIKVSRGILVGLVAAQPIARELEDYFVSQGPLPTDTYITSFLPDTGPVHFLPGACSGYLVQGGYVKGLHSFSVEVK